MSLRQILAKNKIQDGSQYGRHINDVTVTDKHNTILLSLS